MSLSFSGGGVLRADGSGYGCGRGLRLAAIIPHLEAKRVKMRHHADVSGEGILDGVGERGGWRYNRLLG